MTRIKYKINVLKTLYDLIHTGKERVTNKNYPIGQVYLVQDTCSLYHNHLLITFKDIADDIGILDLHTKEAVRIGVAEQLYVIPMNKITIKCSHQTILI